MKAVFIDKPGEQLSVREVPVPLPGPSEVLVKIAAAPVNPSDLTRVRNAHRDSDLNTFIPGLEGSGTVVKAGKGLLPRLWLGKRVACSAHHETSGTWAEYMVTPAGSCFPLSRKVTDEQGSMSLVNPLTALAFIEIVKKNKHRALILNPGASALGKMVRLLARKEGIPVVNLVRNSKQMESIEGSVPDHVIDTSSPGFIEELKELSEKLKATILFDSICSPTLTAMIDALPVKSSIVIYGNMSITDAIQVDPASFIQRDIKISGFYLGNKAQENGLLRNMLNLIKVSRLMSHDLKIDVRERFPLEEVQNAIESYTGNMSAGKILLVNG